MGHVREARIGMSPAAEAMRRLGEWVQRRQTRRSFGVLSDRMLRDAGLTSADVEAALALPLGEDASDQLARRAVAQAANW